MDKSPRHGIVKEGWISYAWMDAMGWNAMEWRSFVVGKYVKLLHNVYTYFEGIDGDEDSKIVCF
jgi:hypothetical protein